jgi:hypothetical protein
VFIKWGCTKCNRYSLSVFNPSFSTCGARESSLRYNLNLTVKITQDAWFDETLKLITIFYLQFFWVAPTFLSFHLSCDRRMTKGWIAMSPAGAVF